jgi:hypothetical protein
MFDSARAQHPKHFCASHGQFWPSLDLSIGGSPLPLIYSGILLLTRSVGFRVCSTHWTWKNCPVAWQGMYQDKDGHRSIIMEAVATHNLWIWHSFAGLPDSNNDINVIDRSPLVVDWLKGNAPEHRFRVNEHDYNMCYLLCDGIYPEWSVFVKTIGNPTNEKEALYAKMQEGARKDVERCFGVLQGRFAILANPARLWGQGTLQDVWYACVVMHNMIIEAEEGEGEESDYIESVAALSVASMKLTFDSLLQQLALIQDAGAHAVLRDDLVEHIWQRKSDREL